MSWVPSLVILTSTPSPPSAVPAMSSGRQLKISRAFTRLRIVLSFEKSRLAGNIPLLKVLVAGPLQQPTGADSPVGPCLRTGVGPCLRARDSYGDGHIFLVPCCGPAR